MAQQNDDFWGEAIFRYTRAQAIADGLLVDLTLATDDKRQRLCEQAGFKVPVAITRTAWNKTIEAGGAWQPSGEGEILELKVGQSLTGRLWDVLRMLRVACDRAGDNDRIHFQVLVEVNGDGITETVNLWALCGPGDDAKPVITIMTGFIFKWPGWKTTWIRMPPQTCPRRGAKKAKHFHANDRNLCTNVVFVGPVPRRGPPNVSPRVH